MDLKNPRWIYAKGVMFVLIGAMSFALVLMECPSFMVAVLLLVMIWAFCRGYYFAFYVIEKYVDSRYRFSGITDFVKYLKRGHKEPPTPDRPDRD